MTIIADDRITAIEDAIDENISELECRIKDVIQKISKERDTVFKQSFIGKCFYEPAGRMYFCICDIHDSVGIRILGVWFGDNRSIEFLNWPVDIDHISKKCVEIDRNEFFEKVNQMVQGFKDLVTSISDAKD